MLTLRMVIPLLLTFIPATAWAGEPAAAATAAKVLPAQTDVVLTFNFRQFLEDHKQTDAVQGLLASWRRAIRADEKTLRELGLNPLEDVDRVTCGFRRSQPDSWVVIVEGRFQEERLRQAIARPAANGTFLTLLNNKTLAIAERKDVIAEIAARARDAKDGTFAPVQRALLEQAEKQHVTLFLDHVDTLLAEAGTAWIDEAARAVGGGDEALARFVLAQVASWTNRYGKDIASARIGLSVRGSDSSLHVGLAARTQAIAKELASRLDGVRVLAALAAKASDNQRTRDLGDILLRARVTAADASVAFDVPIPHAFVQTVADDAGTTLHPLIERLQRRVMNIPLWRPLPPAAPGALDVEEVRDIAYRDGPSADPIRHRLDLVLPRGRKNYPVVVLVHGGGWVMGDNRCCGLYTSVAHFLAGQGIGVVLPNYRLSPAVAHPEHVRDVARAVRWTRDHIAEYGGSPERLFLAGHSAGGHLVALLATDEAYLKAEELGVRDIKGVIAVSGVYRIPPGTMEAFVGGSGTRSFRPDQVLPLRGETGSFPTLPALGISVKVNVFGGAFGDDAKSRADASPVNHVRRGLPPFLILAAERDLPTLAEMAAEFHKALVREGCAAELLQVRERNHNTLMFSVIRPDDPAARAVLNFVK
jgi:acetyl esterase/lipase